MEQGFSWDHILPSYLLPCNSRNNIGCYLSSCCWVLALVVPLFIWSSQLLSEGGTEKVKAIWPMSLREKMEGLWFKPKVSVLRGWMPDKDVYSCWSPPDCEFFEDYCVSSPSYHPSVQSRDSVIPVTQQGHRKVTASGDGQWSEAYCMCSVPFNPPVLKPGLFFYSRSDLHVLLLASHLQLLWLFHTYLFQWFTALAFWSLFTFNYASLLRPLLWGNKVCFPQRATIFQLEFHTWMLSELWRPHLGGADIFSQARTGLKGFDWSRGPALFGAVLDALD